MPTGRGFYWKKDGKYFNKKLMTNERISTESIVAMDLLNKDPMFVNENGERVRIMNGWFSSEQKFENYPVDGWAQVDEKLYLIQ